MINIIFSVKGSIDDENTKDEYVMGKQPFLWSQISDHAIITLTYQSYESPIPTLHSSYSHQRTHNLALIPHM